MDHLLRKLDEVEAEMKAIGYWSKIALARDEQKTFEHWLQFTFLPEARRRIKLRDIPTTSQVGAMAMRQYDYHTYIPEAQRLFVLLSEFDRLIEAAAKA
jgi:uncharacterized protein YqcC (DUF446 family)